MRMLTDYNGFSRLLNFLNFLKISLAVLWIVVIVQKSNLINGLCLLYFFDIFTMPQL
jgi:hypothetical protein